MRGTAEARFWAKVPTRPEDPAACWKFTGGRDQDGYGMFWFNGRTIHAARFVWMMTDGPVPAGMFVCHTCDNPPCARRLHLFLGTPGDNMQDKLRKGRSACGTGHGMARLTEDQVRLIRRLFSDGMPKKRIAREIGCSAWTVTKIVTGQSWKSVA